MNKHFVAGFEKKAFLPQAASMFGRAALNATKAIGRTIWNNKGKTLTAGFVGMDALSGAKAGAQATRNAKLLNNTI